MKKLILLVLIFLVGFAAAQDTQVSKKELYARAREVLKESLEKGDTAKATQALEYLQQNVKNGAPLIQFEEYLIYGELNRYDEAIRKYSHGRRLILDSAYIPEKDPRINVKDGLQNYLYRDLAPFTKEKMDSLYIRAVASDASQENKDLYGVLLYGESVIGIEFIHIYSPQYPVRVIRDTTTAEEFLQRAKAFVEKYPMSEHSTYLKNFAIPFVQNYMDEQRLFRKNPWAYKYYTGGIALYGGTWFGFLSGDATDYIDSERDFGVYLEIELQFKRIVLGGFYYFGYITTPNNDEFANALRSQIGTRDGWTENDLSVGLTLGFVAYEDKYVKVTPFLGYGATDYAVLEWDNDPQWILGVNVDSRLLMTRPVRLGNSVSFGISARFKYMMQIGELTDDGSRWWNGSDLPEVNAGTVNHTFAFELGLFVW